MYSHHDASTRVHRLKLVNYPSQHNTVVFNGDYVDRGAWYAAPSTANGHPCILVGMLCTLRKTHAFNTKLHALHPAHALARISV